LAATHTRIRMCTSQEIPFVVQDYSSVTGVVAVPEEPELAKTNSGFGGKER
jgi:hypothetical protein